MTGAPGSDPPAVGEPTDPRRIIADGYDRIAERYLGWSGARPSGTRRAWLERALREIPPGAHVLDLGCGSGIPMTQALATDGRQVTGVDLSTRQLELARAAVPGATFLQADMTEVTFPSATFDAVVAFYSLTHVPRAALPGLLSRIRDWLRPGGIFLASLGAQDSPDEIEEDWLGVPMFFSHHGAKRNRALVREAGFEMLEAVVQEEPGDRHGALFLWVLARRPEEAPRA